MIVLGSKNSNKRRGRARKQNNENNPEVQRGRPKAKKQVPKANQIQKVINGERQDAVRRHNCTNQEKLTPTKDNKGEEQSMLLQKPVENEIEGKGRESKSEEYKERIRKAIEKSAESAPFRQRSNSAASLQSQKNLRARYWSYLFDNFHRAVDEIYATCDHDESIIECQVCALMLLNIRCVLWYLGLRAKTTGVHFWYLGLRAETTKNISRK